MKKIKLLSSLLGLGAIVGVVTPIVTSCDKNNEEEDHPIKEQCTVSFTEEAAKVFKLGVTRIPKGHKLMTKVTCTDNYSFPEDVEPDIVITVGEQSLEETQYIITYPEIVYGKFYWTLIIDEEYVTGDIVIDVDVDEAIPVVPINVETDDKGLFKNAFAHPIPLTEYVEQGTNIITIESAPGYNVLPTEILKFQNQEFHYRQETGNLAVGEWRIHEEATQQRLTNEIKIDVNFPEYHLGHPEVLTINCSVNPEDNIPGIEYNGVDVDIPDNPTPLIEDTDYQIVSGDLTTGKFNIKLIGDIATTKKIKNVKPILGEGESIAGWLTEGTDYTLDYAAENKEFTIQFTWEFYRHLYSKTEYSWSGNLSIYFEAYTPDLNK